MLIVILGVLAGLLLGYCFPVTPPAGSTPYILTLLCLAAYSALSGVRAQLRGVFSARRFASRLLLNSLFGLLLCWIGIKLDLPVYLAAVTAISYMCFREIGLLSDAIPIGSEETKCDNMEKPR